MCVCLLWRQLEFWCFITRLVGEGTDCFEENFGGYMWMIPLCLFMLSQCFVIFLWREWYLKSTLFLFDFLTIACLKRNLTSHSNFKKFVSSISKCSWKKHLSLLNINFPQSWGKVSCKHPSSNKRSDPIERSAKNGHWF